IRRELVAAATALKAAVEWIARTYGTDTRAAHAAAVPYLKLWGLLAGGWQLGRGALIANEQLLAGGGDSDFLRAKIATARFYAEALLPQAEALAQSITEGSDAALALTADQF